MDATQLAVIAATMAKVGTCPITNRRCLRPSTVKSLLSVMYTCGLNQLTGKWDFKVGVPAATSSSGVTIMVVPGKMGICV